METVVDVFRKTFLSYGYQEKSSAPIFPCPDPTTLFTSATISVLKPDLFSENPERSFVIQPCLRNHNLKRTLDRSFDPEYFASFLMFGMLCPITQFDSCCVLDFFDHFPDLKGRVIVRSSHAIRHEAFETAERGFETEYDSRSASYYSWRYGQPALTGQGITFALKQPNGECLDVGNLVIIYLNSRAIAVEFGFGQETFEARQRGLGDVYMTSPDYIRLGVGFSASEKRLGDSLATAKCLLKCGVTPGRGRASSVLRKALRNACFLAVKEWGPAGPSLIRILSRKLSDDSLWLTTIDATLEEVRESIRMFEHEVRHMRNHVSGQYLEKKIQEYRLRYGIPDQF